MKKTLGIIASLSALLALTGCGSSADTEACELIQDEFNELDDSSQSMDWERLDAAMSDAFPALSKAKSAAEDTDLHVAMVAMHGDGKNGLSGITMDSRYFDSKSTIQEICASEYGVEFDGYVLPEDR